MKASDIKPLGVLELKEKNKFMKKYETSSAAELQLRLRSVEIGKEREKNRKIGAIPELLLVIFGAFGSGYERQDDITDGILWVIFGIIGFWIYYHFRYPDKLSLLDEETALKVLLAAKMSGENI